MVLMMQDFAYTAQHQAYLAGWLLVIGAIAIVFHFIRIIDRE